jgi:hypothetical protein
MKASSENTETMKKFLQVLDMYFSTDKVKIDTTTYNNSINIKNFITKDMSNFKGYENSSSNLSFPIPKNEVKRQLNPKKVKIKKKAGAKSNFGNENVKNKSRFAKENKFSKSEIGLGKQIN